MVSKVNSRGRSLGSAPKGFSISSAMSSRLARLRLLFTRDPQSFLASHQRPCAMFVRKTRSMESERRRWNWKMNVNQALGLSSIMPRAREWGVRSLKIQVRSREAGGSLKFSVSSLKAGHSVVKALIGIARAEPGFHTRGVNRSRDAGSRVLLGILLLMSAPAHAATTAPPHPHPFLVEHCVGCHGPEKQKGDFRIDTQLSLTFSNRLTADRWREVLNVLNGHELVGNGVSPPFFRFRPHSPHEIL